MSHIAVNVIFWRHLGTWLCPVGYIFHYFLMANRLWVFQKKNKTKKKQVVTAVLPCHLSYSRRFFNLTVQMGTLWASLPSSRRTRGSGAWSWRNVWTERPKTDTRSESRPPTGSLRLRSWWTSTCWTSMTTVRCASRWGHHLQVTYPSKGTGGLVRRSLCLFCLYQ